MTPLPQALTAAMLLIAASLLIAVPSAGAARAGGLWDSCPSFDGESASYTLYAKRVECRDARGWAKALIRSKGAEEPENFRCHERFGTWRNGGVCKHRKREKARQFYFNRIQ